MSPRRRSAPLVGWVTPSVKTEGKLPKCVFRLQGGKRTEVACGDGGRGYRYRQALAVVLARHHKHDQRLPGCEKLVD